MKKLWISLLCMAFSAAMLLSGCKKENDPANGEPTKSTEVVYGADAARFTVSGGPKFTLAVDMDQLISFVEPADEDTNMVLDGLHLLGLPFEEGFGKIVKSAMEKGMVKDGDVWKMTMDEASADYIDSMQTSILETAEIVAMDAAGADGISLVLEVSDDNVVVIYEEPIDIENPEPEVCPECEGTGWVKCEACNGTGNPKKTEEYDCECDSETEKDGPAECDECSGRGMNICPKCEGEGILDGGN